MKSRLVTTAVLMILTIGLILGLAGILYNLQKRRSEATVHYLDASSKNARDDEQHGRRTKPWETMEYAFQQLEPGDTLLIRGGIYENAGITLTEEKSGREESPITVKAYPGETVVLTNGKQIRFDGAKWWIIDGLHFDQSQYIRLGLHENLGYEQTVAAEHITIKNCEFRNGKESAISINNGNEILVENNYFHHIRPGEPFSDSGRENNAIVLRYIGNNIVIKNNRFEDIGSDGVHIGSQSYLPGSDIGTVQVIDNEFWVNRPYGGPLGNVGENGIDIKKAQGPILILGNSIHGFRPTMPEQDASGAHGDGLIVHEEAWNITIERNLFYDNTAHLNIARGSGAGPRDIIIRNNIFRESVSSGNGVYTVEGSALQVRSATNVQIYHNTFYNNHRYLVSSDVSRCIFMNNIVVGGRAEINVQNADWEADYNAWSQIKGLVPEILRGEHDLDSADLRLGQNLRPLSNSPVVKAGKNVGVTSDFEGSPRGNPPDLGALNHISN